jgi:hypothetical protein
LNPVKQIHDNEGGPLQCTARKVGSDSHGATLSAQVGDFRIQFRHREVVGRGDP